MIVFGAHESSLDDDAIVGRDVRAGSPVAHERAVGSRQRVQQPESLGDRSHRLTWSSAPLIAHRCLLRAKRA